MAGELIAGGLAGMVMGLVLHRGQLCFHSTIVNALEGRVALAQAWALGVGGAAVGLSVLYLLPGTEDLNTGLAFRPVANSLGGLIIGTGMVVALSCISGLFYKLGSGMLGAGVGLFGWAAGELVARSITVPGPTVLGDGEDGTLAGVLGLPRLLLAGLVLVAVATWAWKRPVADVGSNRWQWRPRTLGLALAAAITFGWVTAALSGTSFGPSSVGAVAGIAEGSANYWLVAFLIGIVAGGALSAARVGDIAVRGETPVRYLQLTLGGFLLGLGGWIAGGCNLGHGLSGAAQLNVSSLVVVAAMIVGVWGSRRLLASGRQA
ncbi:MAG: YeeE/YedE thiosulfate transporter family protein [Propionibacteriales bacterium]|nr:YeeE/YedE thiosulfate transporter family protein [Propionibacteriales bacterium]